MSSRQMKRKVLLMGRSGSGKTSMRSIIFANYLARDTMRLGPTLGVENSHVRFLGSLVLNLWDCGGQDAFMDSYFRSQSDQIFRNVEVLIYVFDTESAFRTDASELQQFKQCVSLLQTHSPAAHLFILIHKMDLISNPQQRQQFFTQRVEQIAAVSQSLNIRCFATSIWDETLYKAWSSIVHTLIPNQEQLSEMLFKLRTAIEADEIVLFEKATFLVISHTTLFIDSDENISNESNTTISHDANLTVYSSHPSSSFKLQADVHRFEKISNLIKQFKLSCSKSGSNFHSMKVTNTKWRCLIQQFSSNTYIMTIQSFNCQDTNKLQLTEAATELTIQAARPQFEKFVQQNMY